MDFKLQLEYFESILGKLVGYENASDEEKCIILLRQSGLSYGDIQVKLGNPSKKKIRQVLLKWNPSLIDIDANKNKLIKRKNLSAEEGELRYLCIKNNRWIWELDYDTYEFYIQDGYLWYKDFSKIPLKFSCLDIASQNQILNEIKSQL